MQKETFQKTAHVIIGRFILQKELEFITNI